jgi:Type VI secretion system (T6SS), amidase effector protein 4
MVTFDDFWSNHPALQTPPVIEPCRGEATFDNQCVIRLGAALTASGVSFASYRGAFCWNGHGRSHPLRVEQMKLWLDSENATFVPIAEKSVRSARGIQNSFRHYLGRRGIVAFLDFWGTGNAGDHIDLWNGVEIARGDLDFFERSREIWFWSMA